VSWIYHKLFHDPRVDGAGTDALLVRLVAPLTDELSKHGAIDRFFFLRYAEEGHHIRLRFRVRADHERAQVESRLDELASGSLLVTRMDRAQYEPETQKHGGPIGQDIAERQFSASSRFALRCIDRTLEHPRSRWLVAAWAFDWMLTCAGIDGNERREFLQAYADHWRAVARTMAGVDLPMHQPDEQAVATVRALAHDPDAMCALVDDAPSFASRIEQDIADLVANDVAGRLHAPLHAIVSNLVHTFHNRLGLSLGGEVWVANLLATVWATRPPSQTMRGIPVEAVASRLIHGALNRRPDIALVEGADPDVLRVLTDAADQAGVHTIRAVSQTPATPFALLHAIADAHPAGARLRIALQRIQDACDPACPLPPDPSGVADALRRFIVCETLAPTLLVLRLDGIDTDTLHALVFLARSLEDLPLALGLVLEGPPPAEWLSFVKALADGPGIVRIRTVASVPTTVAHDAASPRSVASGMNYVRAGAVREGTAIIVEALATEPLAPVARGQALLVLAQAMLRASRPVLAKQALEGVPLEHTTLARRVRLGALHNLGDREGLDTLHHAVVADVARSDYSVTDHAWAMLDAALVSATPERQAEHEGHLDALLAIDSSAVPPQCALAAHAWRAAAYVTRGAHEHAIPHQEHALTYAENLGDFRRALFLRARLAASLAARGNLEAAERLFERTADAATWDGLWDLAALAAQHTVALSVARGERATARTWLLDPRPSRRQIWRSVYGRLAALYLHAEIAFAARDVQTASTHIEQLRTQLSALQNPGHEHAGLLETMVAHLEADVALMLGDTTACETAERLAATLALRIQPIERRLVSALAHARRAAALTHTRHER
jgi:thiopeptide-type bacteriocin biosynthesis protein